MSLCLKFLLPGLDEQVIVNERTPETVSNKATQNFVMWRHVFLLKDFAIRIS